MYQPQAENELSIRVKSHFSFLSPPPSSVDILLVSSPPSPPSSPRSDAQVRPVDIGLRVCAHETGRVTIGVCLFL